MTEDNKFMAGFGLFALGVLLAFWSAYVLWMLWTWFVVPLGAPRIGYWHAYGLGLFMTILSMYLMKLTSIEDTTIANRATAATAKAIGYGLILGGGYLAHWLAGLP